jgi:phosphatidylglycerol:prolipoprotein diacylglycerol transferase
MYPILADLGVWQIRSYGLSVAIAVLVGVWWSAREAERRGFARQLVYDAAWAIAIAGFAGARLWYALFSEPETYRAHPWEILAIWHGGLSMHGALIAGTAVGAWWILRRGLPFWRFADAVAPGLILGQTVGQIACLLNGDTYGKPTDLPWAIVFTHPQAMAPLGVPLHPLQVYELLAYLAVFLLVHRVARSAARDGAVLLAYAVFYGAARFAMEFFRGDPPVVAEIIVPQAVSVALVVAALASLAVLRRRVWRVQEPALR